MAVRRALLGLSLSLACACLVAVGSGRAEPTAYSSQFIQTLNETCWNGPVPSPRRDPSIRRALVRVYLANPTDRDLLQVCAYDLTCGEVVFSGRIRRGDRRAISICPNSSRRGAILILDPFGRLAEYRDLASPATIQLRTIGRR